MRGAGALLIEEHGPTCKMWSLFGAGCDCGASAAATRRIVDDVSAAFGAELKQIMTRPKISADEMSRPRFFPSRVRPPNGIENATRIRTRLARSSA